MKFRRFVAFFVLLVCLGALPAVARPIVLKIGSPTPKGSPWDNALKELAAEWREITGGQVQMRIFSGGVAGEEADVIRKMRFNSLQGAVLTALGINQIYPDAFVLSLPFLMHSDQEFEYVLDRIEGRLKENIEEQGFKVVGWTSVGWIYFFSTEKVIYPDDLRRLKLATSDSDKAIAQAMKALDFNAIPVGLNELLTGLNSGMIDACYTVRLGAAAYQWFGIANHMMDLPISPVLAGIVVSERAWRQIPDEYKNEMIRAAERVAADLAGETEQLEQDAMQIMLDNGLIVHDIPSDAVEEWREDFARGIEMIKGDTFSEDIYNVVSEHLEEYRRDHGTN
jgi:TRAP-type C4-dicarboxylate transport system substrate-binding protein